MLGNTHHKLSRDLAGHAWVSETPRHMTIPVEACEALVKEHEALRKLLVAVVLMAGRRLHIRENALEDAGRQTLSTTEHTMGGVTLEVGP